MLLGTGELAVEASVAADLSVDAEVKVLGCLLELVRCWLDCRLDTVNERWGR